MVLRPQFSWLVIFLLMAGGPTANSVWGQNGGKSADLATAQQPFVDQHLLAGAVMLVANEDGILDLETVGYADIAQKKPMQEDSLFWIASMSKPIAGAAVMMLVDEGKISLDDPITKYLPEFKDQWLAVEQDGEHVLLRRPATPVTIRQVMNHTSGMSFRSALEQPTLDNLPLKVAVTSYAMTPLQTEPGTKYQYSNSGINTGARIVEVVSGLSYEDFLQEKFFGPMGMTDTSFWPTEEQEARLAKSYRPSADGKELLEFNIVQLQYPLHQHAGRYPMPGGGLFSTAKDVATFCRMVLRGGELNGRRYLSEKAVKEMTMHQTGDLPTSYGIGWSTEKSSGGPFGHGGAHATQMQVDPGRHLVLVYMVQHGGFKQPEGKEIYPGFVKLARDTYATP